jgi:hypothetical protein
MPLQVTATQAPGITAPGMLLRVDVLTGCAAVQDGASAVFQSGLNPPHTTLVTTVTGSVVYGALVRAEGSTGTGPFTAAAGNTLDDNEADLVHARFYAAGRVTVATGIPGPVAVGASAPGHLGRCGCAFAEILPDGTISRDTSSPPPVFDPGATAVTSDSFTPPAGALLVARVASNGSTTSPQFVALDGGGLTWLPLIEQHGTGFFYTGVWAAQF